MSVFCAAHSCPEPCLLCGQQMRMGSIVFGPVDTGPKVELAALIEKARHHVMTPKEKYEQMVSGIYGLLPMRSTITLEEIKQMLAEKGIVDPEPGSDCLDIREEGQK